MSLDANYILVYQNLPYCGVERPWNKDMYYLKERYGGEFCQFEETSMFWEKPKYLLPSLEFEKLYADQILMRASCELWVIVK